MRELQVSEHCTELDVPFTKKERKLNSHYKLCAQGQPGWAGGCSLLLYSTVKPPTTCVVVLAVFTACREADAASQ